MDRGNRPTSTISTSESLPPPAMSVWVLLGATARLAGVAGGDRGVVLPPFADDLPASLRRDFLALFSRSQTARRSRSCCWVSTL